MSTDSKLTDKYNLEDENFDQASTQFQPTDFRHASKKLGIRPAATPWAGGLPNLRKLAHSQSGANVLFLPATPARASSFAAASQ